MRARLTLVLLTFSCCVQREQPESNAYLKALDDWHAARWQDLRGEEGWLNLAGLFWLEEGMNAFGNDHSGKVVFPEDFPLRQAGFFMVEGGQVRMVTTPDAGITVDGVPVQDVRLFHPDSTSVVFARKGWFRWNVIRRENRLGIRLRNLDSTFIAGFKPPTRFEANPDLKFQARFIPYGPGHTIMVSNVLGQTTPQPSPGRIHFTVRNTEFAFDALEGGKELFIVFGDSTTGHETYSGGRFLYTPLPDQDGFVELDFNKAINPPCVFTPFATCPLPPSQNVLHVAIRAGEKNFHH